MTYVPRDASEVLPAESPKIGSVSQAQAAAAFLRDIQLDAHEYRVSAQRAAGSLAAERSDGVSAIVSKLSDRLEPGAAMLYEAAADAQRAFSAYGAGIDQIHARADMTLNDVDDALSTIRVQAAEIAEIAALIRVSAAYSWREGAPGAMPHPALGQAAADLSGGQRDAAEHHLRMAYENQWLHAAVLWQSAVEVVERGIARWNALLGERRSAEAQLRQGIGNTAIGQLVSLSASAGSAQRATVAFGVAGELWGVSGELKTAHPLLTSLFGSASGAQAWAEPPPPERTTAWWNALSPSEQAELIAEVPWVIGNLPGLPYAVRDNANRAALRFAQGHPVQLTTEQLALMAGLQGILSQEQEQIERYGAAMPPIQIVALDLRGAVPRVAVAYGDLDTATHTTWEVPGMNNDAHLALDGWDRVSRDLYLSQRILRGFSGTNAVVAWLGYDTPSLPQAGNLGVLSSQAAAQGAQRLAAELDGEFVAREAGGLAQPFRAPLAHSYGTTVATIALTLVEHPVDALAMLGSAGLDTTLVTSLGALQVHDVAGSPGQAAIYTANASGDHLAAAGSALSGRGLPNPDATAGGLEQRVPVYGGALSFTVEGDASRGLLSTDGHSITGEGAKPDPLLGMSASAGHGYLDPRTQALSIVAKITTEQIDPQLQRSFVVTETQRVEFVVVGKTAVSMRVASEELK